MTSERNNIRILSNAVKYRVNPNAIRDLQHPLNGILLGVQNDVICSMTLRELRLGIGRCRANNSGALELGILGGNETESPRNGVDENRVAFLDLVCFVHKREDGHCL